MWPRLRLVSVSLLLAVCSASLYLTACTTADILGEMGRLNCSSSQPQLEDILLVAEDDLAHAQLARRPTTAADNFTELFPGYRLYWATMTAFSNGYSPVTFQVVKLILLAVSLINILTSGPALLCTLLHSERWCRCWCCHPTPLKLAEAALGLTTVLVMVIILLGDRDTRLSLPNFLAGLALVLLSMLASWALSDFYRMEKERLGKEEEEWEEKEELAKEESLEEMEEEETEEAEKLEKVEAEEAEVLKIQSICSAGQSDQTQCEVISQQGVDREEDAGASLHQVFSLQRPANLPTQAHLKG